MHSYTNEMDKYYEQMDSDCRCDIDDIENDSEMCLYCEIQEMKRLTAAAEAAQAAAIIEARKQKPFGIEIAAIRTQLTKFQNSHTMETQIHAARCLYTVLLGCEKLLATKPKFRAMALQKEIEFRSHSVAGPMLKELFDHFDTMIQRLPQIEGYKAT